MEASLNINSRRNAAEFIDDIRSGKSTPLKNITSDYHYHVVEADSENTLDMIQEALVEKDFLLEQEECEMTFGKIKIYRRVLFKFGRNQIALIKFILIDNIERIASGSGSVYRKD